MSYIPSVAITSLPDLDVVPVSDPGTEQTPPKADVPQVENDNADGTLPSHVWRYVFIDVSSMFSASAVFL